MPLFFWPGRATLESRLSRWCPAIAVAALTVWLFGSALIGTRTFVFRDAAHYFAPLFQFNVAEWRAGRVPLWNPYEGIGMPQLAENTASVFYPAQLLLLLPVDFYWAYNIYIVSHVLLAAWGAYRLARHLGTSHLAGGQAALAYAFSGSVLFQYCNVIFLIGAAWLPFALLATDRLLRGGGWRSAAALGFCWAMMVLGGDPQMAYHAALLAGVYALYLSWTRAAEPGAELPKSSMSPFLKRGAALLGAGTIAFALAAVQILPTLELAAMSSRAQYDLPRSLWELAAVKLRGEQAPAPGGPTSTLAAFANASLGGEHLQRAYEFSVGPWRWLELLWPNVGGRQFPEHRRWMSALPWEGRIWSPSLYCGAIAIVLAWGGWRLRRTDSRLRCCAWMTLWAAAAGLGEYGLGWLLQEFGERFGARDALSGIGTEFGGLYWLMNLLLPGYVAFRYPAKLWTIAALGISLLAARGWDAAWSDETQVANSRFRRLAIVSLCGAAGILLGREWFCGRFATLECDPLFGPLDAVGAWTDLLAGLTSTGIVCCAAAGLLRAAGNSSPRHATAGLLLLSLLDVAAAQRWLLPTVAVSELEDEPRIARMLPREGDSASDFLPRIYRDRHWLPLEWARKGSPDRLRDMLRWDRETLWPKYHLPLRIGTVETSGMLVPNDYVALWNAAREHGTRRWIDREFVPSANLLDLLGARSFVMPYVSPHISQYIDKEEMVYSLGSQGSTANLQHNSHAHRRAWIAHHAIALPLLADRAPRNVRARTEEVLFPDRTTRDWANAAVVETSNPLPCPEPPSAERSSPQPPAANRSESCSIARSDPQHVVVDAQLATPGLVVLSDMFYPGWEVIIEDEAGRRPGEILRTNRVMRGVWLAAGKHRLEFRCRPDTFRWGAWISGATWLLGAGVVIAGAITARRKPAA